MKSNLNEVIYNLEKKLLVTEIRNSPDELNLLLHDNFIEYGKSGNIYTKNDCIGVDGIGEINVKILDFEIEILSKQSVLAKYKSYNVDKDKTALRSSIWIFENNRWQLLFHQGTPS
ncbi:DUF4440 domain-containing protein [Mycoplasmatota bacterium WC44]